VAVGSDGELKPLWPLGSPVTHGQASFLLGGRLGSRCKSRPRHDAECVLARLSGRCVHVIASSCKRSSSCVDDIVPTS